MARVNWQPVFERAAEVVRGYDTPVTLRQLFYRLVSEQVIPNTTHGGQVSWIEVRLSPEPDGRARLELEHIAHIDDEIWAQFGPGAVGIGWDMGFTGLAIHLSTGQAADPRRAAAWQASDEAKRFMTLSSERWRDANVAAGTAQADAGAAADRCTAAYSGGTS